MTFATVVGGSVHGTVVAPPSKSYTHRAVVVGSLSSGEYEVRRPLESDDTLATARGLASLGFPVRRKPTIWRISPREARENRGRTPTVDCAKSGTTLRFLAAVAARDASRTRFVGNPELVRRPMGPLIAALRAGGVTIRASSALSGLPFEIEGPLGPLDVALRADVSSQFVSALLLVLPTIPGTSRIRFLGTAVSFDYVRATVDILRAHGIKLTLTRAGTRVSGAQEYHGSYFEVPGDASSAAYLWAAAAATDGSVRVRGIDRTWRQADLAILPVLRRMGARVELHSDGATVSGESLRGVDVDLTNSPDLYPLVAVLAAIARGRSRLLGASHVVFKESDRRAASAALVRSFGGRTAVSRGRLVIEHGDRLRPLRAGNFSDHRMVMAAAVGALAVAGRSRIGQAEEVRKSFPGFWKTLKLLGARVEANR